MGLTLDEAVDRARLHALEWGQQLGLFDWGLYMVHMPSPRATLFPRVPTAAVARRQNSVRREHGAAIGSTLQLARELDGMNFGDIMSLLIESTGHRTAGRGYPRQRSAAADGSRDRLTAGARPAACASAGAGG